MLSFLYLNENGLGSAAVRLGTKVLSRSNLVAGNVMSYGIKHPMQAGLAVDTLDLDKHKNPVNASDVVNQLRNDQMEQKWDEGQKYLNQNNIPNDAVEPY